MVTDRNNHYQALSEMLAAAGATATILTEYVRDLGVGADETLGFLRGTTPAEYDASSSLHERADKDLLR